MGTLALVPVFVGGLVRTHRLIVLRDETPASYVQRSSIAAARIGRGLMLATATGMALGGATILLIGMTSVFVADDLAFMRVSVAHLNEVNARLIPLIAHDRAGFGGALLSTGLIVGSCVWFAPMTRSLRQALWLAGAAGFGCAIGVHFAVGYMTWKHLAPAIAGAAMFVAGMTLSSFRHHTPSS